MEMLSHHDNHDNHNNTILFYIQSMPVEIDYKISRASLHLSLHSSLPSIYHVFTHDRNLRRRTSCDCYTSVDVRGLQMERGLDSHMSYEESLSHLTRKKFRRRIQLEYYNKVSSSCQQIISHMCSNGYRYCEDVSTGIARTLRSYSSEVESFKLKVTSTRERPMIDIEQFQYDMLHIILDFILYGKQHHCTRNLRTIRAYWNMDDLSKYIPEKTFDTFMISHFPHMMK